MRSTLRYGLFLTALLLVAGTQIFAQSNAQGSQVQPAARAYEVTVTSNVRNADIYIDGVRQRETTPGTFRLRSGTYSFRVSSRGYGDWQDRITVTRDTNIYAQLTPPYATVRFDVPNEYLNDEVWDPWRFIHFSIDGRRYTDEWIEVRSGWHDIAVVSGGLKIETRLYLEPGEYYDLEMILELAFNTSPTRRSNTLQTQPR